MAVALDTCILIHLVSSLPENPPDVLIRKRTDCRTLCAQQREICIPNIVLVEIMPYLRGEELVTMRAILEKADVLNFGTDASLLAEDLVRSAHSDPKVCRICLNHIGSKPCKGCGSVSSRADGLNDYMIAASAAVASHVTTLYTYDIRAHIVAGVGGKLEILEPENASGPLFAAAACDSDSLDEGHS